MICPHCKYEHGWNNEEEKDIIGKKNVFYTLPVNQEKPFWKWRTINESKNNN